MSAEFVVNICIGGSLRTVPVRYNCNQDPICVLRHVLLNNFGIPLQNVYFLGSDNGWHEMKDESDLMLAIVNVGMPLRIAVQQQFVAQQPVAAFRNNEENEDEEEDEDEGEGEEEEEEESYDEEDSSSFEKQFREMCNQFMTTNMSTTVPHSPNRNFSVYREVRQIRQGDQLPVQRMVTQQVPQQFQSVQQPQQQVRMVQQRPQQQAIAAPPAQGVQQGQTVQCGTHAGVECDGCQGAVVGSRFKCLLCANYDLCANCKSRGVHNHHSFLRLDKPTNCVRIRYQ